MKNTNIQVDGDYLLQKFSGKGGWTYAEIPQIKPDKKNPFGWVKVSGKIDSYELKQYKLMPMGNGLMFLPVKAEIRKKIKKEAGDSVHITLWKDELPLEIPQELIDCFEFESTDVFQTFMRFAESEQKAYLDWIYSVKTDETKVSRINAMMERLKQGLKFYD